MPTITWALVLVVLLANGAEERTALADPPFTNLSACSIYSGVLARRGLSPEILQKIPMDAQRAYMVCVKRWRFRR